MGIGVTTAMIIVECLGVAMITMSKAAMERGMSDLVYISYSNALAIFFLLPASLFFYRNRALPSLTCPILFRIFLLAQLSCCAQILLNYGIWFSSPTLASAMLDLTPAFTFLIALIFRMEQLKVRAKNSWYKSFGTIVSIAGALTVTLYKGLPITKPPFLDTNTHLVDIASELQSKWAIGGFLLAGAALSMSLVFIVQTWTIRDYPEELIVTLIACIFVTIQSTTIALVAEKDSNAWTLKPGLELITICYTALFGVAIRSVIHTWACKKKGPVYVSMFRPLSMVIALVMGVSFLGDTLYLGSVIGAAIIATGFYSVIWGQVQEEKDMEAKDKTDINCGLDEESSPHVPLLRNKSMEI